MPAPAKTQRLRLIGGLWRSRRLSFPAREGLRPTPDRVRETVFNWLAPALPGARCLDLFAGSGALGFEALSRGATTAVLVEKDRVTEAILRQSAHQLEAHNATIIAQDALEFLAATPASSFDIVFLDPPFGTELLAAALTLMLGRGILAPAGLVYLEAAADGGWDLPSNLRWHRQGNAGKVRFGLAVSHKELR